MLSYLVEDLVHKNKLNEAKGVCLRHELIDFIRDETRELLADVKYDPAKDPPRVDEFGPFNKNCLSLPPHVQVEMIST